MVMKRRQERIATEAYQEYSEKMRSPGTDTCIKNSLSEEELQKFRELGFAGPFKFIEPQYVDSITQELKEAEAKALIGKRLLAKIVKIPNRHEPCFVWGKAKWDKGLHAAVPQINKLSTNPIILDKVESIIGENILQFSAHILSKKSNINFTWHGDVETIEWEGVTAWIALSGVTKQSCMSIITRSHNLPNYTYPQELNKNFGLDQTDDQAVLEAAQKLDPKCELLSVDTKPGEFFIFSGRLWHSAKNSSSLERTSMIFQYCQPSETVKIPVNLSPPLVWKSTPAPCLLVRGKDEYGHNLIVPPPK